MEKNKNAAASAAVNLASQLVTAHELEVAKDTLEKALEEAQEAIAEPLCNRILWWRREKRVKEKTLSSSIGTTDSADDVRPHDSSLLHSMLTYAGIASRSVSWALTCHACSSVQRTRLLLAESAV